MKLGSPESEQAILEAFREYAPDLEGLTDHDLLQILERKLEKKLQQVARAARETR